MSSEKEYSPLVSVVIPCYNAEKYLVETLESVLSQTYTNWECIVVDDGSTDGSCDLILSFLDLSEQFKFIKRQLHPKGASTCRNLGIEIAKGGFLIFLDSDDLLTPSCIENRVRKMKEFPKLDFGVFNMGYFISYPEEFPGVLNKFSNDLNDYLKMFLTYQLPWAVTCPIWKTSFIKKNHIRFSEKYQRMQDPEFHTKILIQHKPVFEVFKTSEIDCYYRQSKRTRKPLKEVTLVKLTESILCYYTDMKRLITQNENDIYFELFVINIFHSLLFYNKLPSVKPIIFLYNQMNSVRPISNLTLFNIRLFGLLNRSGLTFIKGAGVSLLWKISVK